ncbi:MAG: hypothetical protein LDLANPLL_00297 [Turneriella sp.]|nr:hypothetical protein [Turneriella sp.]
MGKSLCFVFFVLFFVSASLHALQKKLFWLKRKSHFRAFGLFCFALSITVCAKYSTQELLDGDFLKNGAHLAVTAPQNIQTGVDFTVEVRAADSAGNATLGKIPTQVVCSVLGNGSLSLVSYT